MSTRKHYSRAGRRLSGFGSGIARAVGAAFALFVALVGLPAQAQYPGQIQTKKSEPVLRAVAVLEWTGKLEKPTFSRLVPVTIFDGQTLQNGGIYMARPQPLGLDSGTEYILEKNGQHVGLFDIEAAGQLQGTWMGLGKWKPMPHVKPKWPNPELAKVDLDDESGGKPILHRKHHPGEAKGGSGASAKPAPDPDRPTLHRAGQSAGQNAGQNNGQGDESTNVSGADAGTAPPRDPDRPILMEPKKEKKKSVSNEVAYVSDLPNISDPGRPRLMRGKPKDDGSPVAPELMGLPPEMHQMVAVSDAVNRPEHVWTYTWANPGDEITMKTEMESIARDALGLNTPPPKPEPKTKRSRRHAKPEVMQLTLPPELHDEDFRVFALAYGSGATMVFTADTGGPLKDEKFVTLIGQPDLYGNVAILMKHVGDGAHLDDSPRMRLVDAVDAMADNRGELLFELRGQSGRQFALYRVLHGSVERIFASTPEWFNAGPDGAAAEQ